ncbi:MAG: hypothetical protein E4H36_12280 [Spirochaetales bacterium]|nr:MAG: hypothetical protein E4H36_12280 [Spirochaetales bacterium]
MPFYEGYNEMAGYAGSRGVVTAFHSFGASPMHFILRKLMGLADFYYTLTDCREEMLAFARKVAVFYDASFRAAADSPAEIIMSGTNFNTIITPPYFFEEFIREDMKSRAVYLEQKGKLLAAHPDGENTGLLELYRKSGMHIADSICPSPMTRLSLKEIREVLGGDIAIFGGLPSICVLKNSMNDGVFRKLVDDSLESLGSGRRVVLSVSDTTPPDADLERVAYIAAKAQEFGPVG